MEGRPESQQSAIPIPEKIDFFSMWLGFACPPSHAAKLVISRQGNRFVRELLPEGRVDRLSDDLIPRFLEALRRPVVPELTPALFDLPEAVLRRHYGSAWTDDYPALLVKVTFPAGRLVTIRTEAQQAFMLPLEVTDSTTGRTEKTFEPHLSQALAALMPDGYPEKERLGGNHPMLALNSDLDGLAPLSAAGGLQSGGSSPDGAVGGGSGRTVERSEGPGPEGRRSRSGAPEIAESGAGQRHDPARRLLKKTFPLRDVRELLVKGANPNIADDVGQTALMHAAFPPFDGERFRLLAEAGADLEARRNDGATGLQVACAGGEAPAVEAWVRAGADVHSRTLEGQTPLMLAARWGDAVRVLLTAGADPNATDQEGISALLYAMTDLSPYKPEQQLDAIRALIEAGANLNARDRQGVSVLTHAKRTLAEILLAEEVASVLRPGPCSPPALEWTPRRMAEAVIEMIQAAGGRE